MRPRRLLIVTIGTADRTRGAAQMALNLATALAARGHEVSSFATGQAPVELPFWKHLAWHQRRLEALLDTAPPVDVLDLPAVGISKRVARFAPAVARSIQPDLRYFLAELPALRQQLWRQPIRAAAGFGFQLVVQGVILRRMSRARVVLCLGSRDWQWCKGHFGWLQGKLSSYDNALDPSDRAEIAKVRGSRQPVGGGRALRYLWVGRWAAHKGVRTLCRFLDARVRSHPLERFTIAGCGGLSVGDLTPETVATGRVEVIPAFEREQLPSLLAAHHAGLFTSRVEGWGLSLNEMLEAGLTVYATEAGGVADLRPYFPRQLLPFPPPAAPVLGWPPDELTEYDRRFSWPAIAARYEAEVLAALSPREEV